MTTREQVVLVPAPHSARFSVDGKDDPVLAALDEAETRYREMRSAWEEERQTLEGAREEAAQDQHALRREVERLRGELQQEQQKADRARRRARQLADAFKDIHRALLEGNVYSLILRACATITGATRGVYLTAWGEGNLRVRAAQDWPPSSQSGPSEFIRAVCRKVLQDRKPLVCNQPPCQEQLPEPGQGEQFSNFLAVPAVVLARFNGIVILADKLDGDFDQEDVEQVLGVGDQATVAVENRLLQDELLNSYFNVVGVLADAIEAKDPYTHGHCSQVAGLGRRTAERLGLEPALISVVCFGGLLHDVGKIGVSDGVLNKPGKLLPEEWELMRSHVRIGRDLLSRIPVLSRVADVVMHHHERFDGKGYPEGLRGEEISLAARIISVVDAYSAMTTKRSYKDSLSQEEARVELLHCRGTHFDAAVVDAFLQVLDSPEVEDPCPDGCGVLPSFYHAQELRLALEGLVPALQRDGKAPPR